MENQEASLTYEASGTAKEESCMENDASCNSMGIDSNEEEQNVQQEVMEDNDDEAPYSEQAVQEMNAWAAGEFKELAMQYDNAPLDFNEMLALPEGGKIVKYLEKGLSVTEAYTAACAKRLMENARGAARQEAISGIYSKSHLAPMGGGVADEISVPSDVMEVYHKMFPKMKDAEIRAEYKKQSGY